MQIRKQEFIKKKMYILKNKGSCNNMKENNKNYVTLSVISSFKRIGTRPAIKCQVNFLKS